MYTHVHPADLSGRTVQTPDLSTHEVSATVEYIQRAIGLTPEQLPAELMRAHRKRFGPAAASPQLGAAARSPSPGAQWSPQHRLKAE